jgi:hypothetical protein
LIPPIQGIEQVGLNTVVINNHRQQKAACAAAKEKWLYAEMPACAGMKEPA